MLVKIVLTRGPLVYPFFVKNGKGVSLATPFLFFIKTDERRGGHPNPYPNQYNDNATGWPTKLLLRFLQKRMLIKIVPGRGPYPN